LPKEEFYGKNDRVISIEMFEHMKNYELLLEKISNWLKPEGKVGTAQYTAVDLETTLYPPVTFK
jgi:cyclopropane fatty-acyl-phospholipid synthase-like methyltransferase